MAASILRIARALKERRSYWFPDVLDRKTTELELEEFYRTRSDYHAMTASDLHKADHSQVKLLLSMINKQDTCVDFGCGGGLVLELVSPRCSRAIGIEISDIALTSAANRQNRHAELIKGDVASTGLPSQLADVAYSLEVLEHVWNPEIVITEMLRVLKPGGVLFISTPNGYGLNMHLDLRLSVRVLDKLCAVAFAVREVLPGKSFRNVQPDLYAHPVYPDCDMISKMYTAKLGKFVRKRGCNIERLQTHWFTEAKATTEAAADRFRRLERHPFYRHFGDHILLVARKN